MFDSVGRTVDEGRTRRFAWAACYVTTAALIAAVVAVAPPARSTREPMPDDAVMLLFLEVPNEPDTRWELPAPPPVEPAPDLPEEPDDTGLMRDSAVPGADIGTDIDEDAPRDDDSGRVPGVEGDAGTPEADSEVSRSAVPPTPVPPQPQPVATQPTQERVWELPVRNRLRAEYPAMARRQELGDVTCRMAAWIDRDGEARRVEVLSCPSAFRMAARVALMQARWERFEAPDANTWRRVELDIPFEM